MVFCCIAIVGIALIYFCSLWVRQTFSGPRRDRASGSALPAPPRALFSRGSWPVYGHTFLFHAHAGNCVHLFHPDMTETAIFPPLFFNRKLGRCFALYIWGRWRVCIQGRILAQQVLQHAHLVDAFPWTPPILLLGKSCLSFMDAHDAEQLRLLLEGPLSQRMILPYASQFAELAEQTVEQIRSGQDFGERRHRSLRKWKRNHSSSSSISSRRNTGDEKKSRNNRDIGGDCAGDSANNNNGDSAVSDDFHDNNKNIDGDMDADAVVLDAIPDSGVKLKWDALRSYTLDLIDGPVLGMNQWLVPSQQTKGQSTEEGVDDSKRIGMTTNNNNSSHNSSVQKRDNDNDSTTTTPLRDHMLLWMERIKDGLDVIKITFGPEWMHIWRANEYGRAVNARMKVQDIVYKHIEKVNNDIPVQRRPGRTYYDPSTQPIPILTLKSNFQRDREGIFGTPSLAKSTVDVMARKRSYSAPAATMSSCIDGTSRTELGFEKQDSLATFDLVAPFSTEQDLARPKYENSPLTPREIKKPLASIPDVVAELPLSSPRHVRVRLDAPPSPCSTTTSKSKRHTTAVRTSSSVHTRVSILERLMRQGDRDGNGISQAVLSELSLSLWMMMDVSNAWTAMALTLLATDSEACRLVQEELDELAQEFERFDLFQPTAMNKMVYLDALLYEAIRISPSFLAGLKKTTTTIELKEVGVQLPKNTHIFFSDPTKMSFDFGQAYGKKPHDLGSLYPTLELYGFLPLQGLEVPLMVLQCKVFLAVVLQSFSPFISKKRTFLRRVKAAIDKSFLSSPSNHVRSVAEVNFTDAPIPPFLPISSSQRCESSSSSILAQVPTSVVDELDAVELGDSNHRSSRRCLTPSNSQRSIWRERGASGLSSDVEHFDVDEMFTKLPFPEPRHAISLRSREKHI